MSRRSLSKREDREERMRSMEELEQGDWNFGPSPEEWNWLNLMEEEEMKDQRELESQSGEGEESPNPPQDISGAADDRRRSTSDESIGGEGESENGEKESNETEAETSNIQKEIEVITIDESPKVEIPEPEEWGHNNYLDDSDTESIVELELRQCYGTYCQNPAKPDSKYCSDTCGINLATHRLLTMLASKVREYNEPPCVAQEKSKEELKKTKEKREKLIQKLDTLKEQRENLDKFFGEISQLKYVAAATKKPRMTGAEEGTYFCVSCGHEFKGKTYLNHIEKCFLKIEKEVTLVSATPTTGAVAKEIICDVFNKTTKLYCKRLSIICPEHTKPHNIPVKREICGAPLTDELDVTKICRDSKKACTLHCGWEKLRIADIDFQRLSILQKAEALIAKEFQIQRDIDNRGGILDLLLNDTIDETKPDQQASWREYRMKSKSKTSKTKKRRDPMPSTSAAAFGYPFPPGQFPPNLFPFLNFPFPGNSTSPDDFAYPYAPQQFFPDPPYSFPAPHSPVASTSAAASTCPSTSNTSTATSPDPELYAPSTSTSEDAVFAYPLPPKQFAKSKSRLLK